MPTPSCFDGSRCSACEGSYRCVYGDGPAPCHVVFIGERPGGDENISGRPFSGKSGTEFNYGYLPLAGLERSDIYLTNSTKCGALGNRKPNKGELSACSQKFLLIEIAECNPEIIVLMGATACSLAPAIELSKEHGVLQRTTIMGESTPRWIFPVFHPAAGMHNTGMMIPLLEDFEELGKILRGGYQPITDSNPDRIYREIETVDEIDQTFDRAESETLDRILVGLDTEDDDGALFSAQYSLTPDDGYFIRGYKLPLLQRLGARLHPHVAVVQNDLYDLRPLAQVGIHLHRVIDPMKGAYHLGNLPQGLKPLAYRLCGVRMRSYEDVVVPHSRRVMVEWLCHAMEIIRKDSRVEIDMYKRPLKFNPEKQRAEEYSLEVRSEVTYRMGTVRTVEPELMKPLNRIITHTKKPIEDDAKSVYNPWEKIRDLAPSDPAKAKVLSEQLDKVIKEIGDPPKQSIRHVPIAEAIHYGCDDANLCPRVLREIDKRCMKLGELVPRSDYDR